MPRDNKGHSLTSWLHQIKGNHDKRPSVTIVTPDEHEYVVNDPVVVQEKRDDRPVVVANVEPPVAARASGDVNTSDDKDSVKSKSSIFSVDGARRFRNNLIHFHRPYGLRFQNRSTTAPATDDNNKDASNSNQHQDSNNSSPDANSQHHDNYCSCCNNNTSFNSDADDELDEPKEEQPQDDNVSARSKEWVKQPPCLCNTHISMAVADDNDDDSSASALNEENNSRDNSVFSLPDDIDSPEAGFKKLGKDGDLVDWDELSTFMAQRDDDDEREDQPLVEYAKSRLFTRSVIRNDLIRLALNGPFQSPIYTESKKHVLHVGCGNGAWCTDIAKLYPRWLVVGIDDQTGGPSPDQRKVPRNFKYIRCFYDILKTLKDIPADSFDFIYARFLLDAYGDDCYHELLQECYRICKPGGYAEFYELDMRIYGSPKAGPVTHKLNSKVFQTMETHNLNPRLARKLGDLMSDIFESHKQEPSDQDSDHAKTDNKNVFYANYISLPLGVWGGRLGVIFRDSINDLFVDFSSRDDADSDVSVEGGGVGGFNDPVLSNQDIQTMNKELDSQKSFMNLHHVYARKRPAT